MALTAHENGVNSMTEKLTAAIAAVGQCVFPGLQLPISPK